MLHAKVSTFSIPGLFISMNFWYVFRTITNIKAQLQRQGKKRSASANTIFNYT